VGWLPRWLARWGRPPAVAPAAAAELSPEARTLLLAWIESARARPHAHVGVFVDADRGGRPWDQPQCLVAGRVDARSLHLELSGEVPCRFEVTGIERVERATHAWGPAVCLSGALRWPDADGRPGEPIGERVYLV